MDNLETLRSDPQALSLYLERITLKKENGNWVGICPFHPEKTGSLVVNRKTGSWLFKCFGCGAAGSILDFIQKLDNITLKEAIEKVKARLGWLDAKEKVEHVFVPVGEKEPAKTFSLGSYKIFEDALEKSPEALCWLSEERGIGEDVAKRLHLGYRSRLGGSDSNASNTEAGWICLPYINGGLVTGIKYRSLSGKAFQSQSGMSAGIFNLETVSVFEPVFVAEGELDSVVFEQAGFRSIALPGAGYKLKPEEKDKILQANLVILAGDNDPPGQEAMQRLWADFQERTYLLQWPPGIKDSGEFFLKTCKRDIPTFKAEIEKLVSIAKASPMPYVVSLQDSLATSNRVNLATHPNRLRFPWPTADRMAILLPGSVTVITSTNTKMAKTTLVKEITLYNSRKFGDVVLNYQCELTSDEFGSMVAAGLLEKNRNHLTKEDLKEASIELAGVRYYVGRNPTLTTVHPVLDLIENGIRRLGATIAVLDHIHFITRNSESEIKDQADASQRIKNMAARYGVKFIVVSQPRKAQQNSRGKLLHITDIKGSEAIASDADAIFCIHREYIKTKDPDNPPMDDYDPKMELHLLAARSKGDGPTYCELTFLGVCGKIIEEVKEHGNNAGVL